jgi:hypothetical protein
MSEICDRRHTCLNNLPIHRQQIPAATRSLAGRKVQHR